MLVYALIQHHHAKTEIIDIYISPEDARQDAIRLCESLVQKQYGTKYQECKSEKHPSEFDIVQTHFGVNMTHMKVYVKQFKVIENSTY